MLAQRCANVGHVGHITLIRRWANIYSIRWPNVSWHIKSHLAHRISLGIEYHAVLGRKISSSAYATNVDYDVYFQRNTVLVFLFMFTVINFHNSMMVGFFVIINLAILFLSHGTTKPTKPRTLRLGCTTA